MLWVAGCGFTPVYGTNNDQDVEVSSYLSSITLKQRSGALGQQLENALEDRLNPDASASLYGKAFQLDFTIDNKRDAVVIEQDGSIARYNVLLISNYRLTDTETGEVLDKGSVRRTASFFNAPEKFAAYIAEKDALDRALLELSEDYKLRLAAYFAKNYKLGERNAQ
jgi:LPS-assembly lipoprotein